MFDFFTKSDEERALETRIELFKKYTAEIYSLHSKYSGDIEPNAIIKALLSKYLEENDDIFSYRSNSKFCKTLLSKIDEQQDNNWISDLEGYMTQNPPNINGDSCLLLCAFFHYYADAYLINFDSYPKIKAILTLGKELYATIHTHIDKLLKETADEDWSVPKAAYQAPDMLKFSPDSQKNIDPLVQVTKDIVDELLKGTASEDWQTREFVYIALGSTSGYQSDIVEALIKGTADEHGRAREAAYYALSKLQVSANYQQAIVDTLLKGTTDENWLVRQAAYYALGDLQVSANHQQAIIDALLKGTRDEDLQIGLVAYQVLGNLKVSAENQKVIVVGLIKLTTDKKLLVRLAAYYALSKLQVSANYQQAIVDTLLKGTTDENWLVRKAAYYELGKLKVSVGYQKDIVIALLPRTVDKDKDVRELAYQALTSLVNTNANISIPANIAFIIILEQMVLEDNCSLKLQRILLALICDLKCANEKMKSKCTLSSYQPDNTQTISIIKTQEPETKSVNWAAFLNPPIKIANFDSKSSSDDERPEESNSL